MYTCSCIVERSFRFGMPLVLASVKGEANHTKACSTSRAASRNLCSIFRRHKSHTCSLVLTQGFNNVSGTSPTDKEPLCSGGFQAVALAGFISPLAVAILGPAVGAKLDSTRRQTGLTVANVIQTISITAAGPPCVLHCPKYPWKLPKRPICTQEALKLTLGCRRTMTTFVLSR